MRERHPRSSQCDPSCATMNGEEDVVQPFLLAVEPQQSSNVSSDDGWSPHGSKLQALAKLFVRLHVVIFLLGKLCGHFRALHHKVHLDHAQGLVQLQGFSREMFRGRSSESPMPLTKISHSAMSSSESSKINAIPERCSEEDPLNPRRP